MKPLFWGKEIQAHRNNLSLLVQNRMREMQQTFAKYGSATDAEKIVAAEARRTRKAAKRLKERGK